MPTTQNPYTEHTRQSREEQLEKHAHLVKRVVTRMAARFPPGVDQDELYHVGTIGLLDAVDKFDPKRDVQFKTYAEFRSKEPYLMSCVQWTGYHVPSVQPPMNGVKHGAK